MPFSKKIILVYPDGRKSRFKTQEKLNIFLSKIRDCFSPYYYEQLEKQGVDISQFTGE
jgi:hypothetical protein